TWQALVNDLVPRSEVFSAVTLNSLQFNLARAIGPAIAGVLLASIGPTWSFFFNALSFFGVLLALVFMKTYRKREKSGKILGFAAQWKHAHGFIAGSRMLVACFALSCLVGFAANPIFNLTLVYAERVYGIDALGFGVLAAALGVGSVLFVLGGLLRSRKTASLPRQLVLGLAALAIGHVLFAF